MLARKPKLNPRLKVPLVHEQIALQCAKSISSSRAARELSLCTAPLPMPVVVELQRMDDQDTTCYRYTVHLHNERVEWPDAEEQRTLQAIEPAPLLRAVEPMPQSSQALQLVMPMSMAMPFRAEAAPGPKYVRQKAMHVVDESQRISSFHGRAKAYEPTTDIREQFAQALQRQQNCRQIEFERNRERAYRNGLYGRNGFQMHQQAPNGLRFLNGFKAIRANALLPGHSQPGQQQRRCNDHDLHQQKQQQLELAGPGSNNTWQRLKPRAERIYQAYNKRIYEDYNKRVIKPQEKNEQHQLEYYDFNGRELKLKPLLQLEHKDQQDRQEPRTTVRFNCNAPEFKPRLNYELLDLEYDYDNNCQDSNKGKIKLQPKYEQHKMEYYEYNGHELRLKPRDQGKQPHQPAGHREPDEPDQEVEQQEVEQIAACPEALINGSALPFENYPNELRLLFRWNTCQLCRTTMRTMRNALDHYSSRAHDRRVSSWLIRYCCEEGKISDDVVRYLRCAGPAAFYCALCDLKLTSVMHAQQHFFGRRHRLVAHQHGKPNGAGYYDRNGNWVRTDAKWLVCKLCDVTITSESQMAMHTAGSRHRKRLLTVYNGCGVPVNGSHMFRINANGSLAPLNPLGAYMETGNKKDLLKWNDLNSGFYCEVCNITLNHLKSVKQHEEGRMHKKKLGRVLMRVSYI